LIVGAERRDRLDHPVEHFLVVVLLVEGDERDREVVDLIARDVEQAATQLVIAAQRPDAGARRLDQVLDDGSRNVVAVQRRLERALVTARARLEPVALTDGIVERGIGVERRLVHFMKGGKRLLTISLLALVKKNGTILAVRDRDLLAVREL